MSIDAGKLHVLFTIIKNIQVLSTDVHFVFMPL